AGKGIVEMEERGRLQKGGPTTAARPSHRLPHAGKKRIRSGKRLTEPDRMEDRAMSRRDFKRAALIVGLLVVACSALGTVIAQGTHGKEHWRAIAAKKYEVPEGEKAFALAKELSANLKSSDSELRDDLAYSILTEWILEKNAFTANELLALEAEWMGNL